MTFRTREDRRNQGLGQGGEGYIATDEWCYNCGCCGHWGDVSPPYLLVASAEYLQDCRDIPHRGDLPQEPSAFSTHNTLSGPFFDAELPRSTSRRREPREWEHRDPSSAWGDDLPENVGRQGRRKNAEKMERRMKEQEADEDPEDWFGNPRHARSHGSLRDNEKGPPIGPSKKMSFGKSVQQAGRQFQSQSLADRLGEPLHHTDNRRPAKSRSSRTDYEHNRKNYARRDDSLRHRYGRSEEVGPRYKGGYAR
jgi:protein AIR1/2